MDQKIKKEFLRILLASFIAYLFFVGFMYLNQRSITFAPDRSRTTPAENGLADMQIVQVHTRDGLTLEGWYKAPADPSKPVIVFFHGNAGSLRYRGYKARPLIDAGYGFLYGEYRGYGGNPGEPTEQGFFNDGRAYMDWLIESQSIPQNRIAIFGESIGTGVAVRLAAEYPDAAALVLESPFTTLAAVGEVNFGFLPVDLLLLDRFDNLSLMPKIHMPVLVLHGQRDRIVLFALGKALYEAANAPKEFAVYPEGGHVDLYNYGGVTRILSFSGKV